MDQQRGCNSTSDPMCYGEASGSLAVIVIPSLLALSTAAVVALIFCSILRNRTVRPLNSAPAPNTNVSPHSVSLDIAPVNPSGVHEALRTWEIPEEWAVEGVKPWHSGCFGPVCKGLLKRGGITTAVVVKTLRDGSTQREKMDFAEWIVFHATVCKSDRLVQMLCCQTRRPPMSLILEACTPGNLLHFLWTLRKNNPDERHQMSPFSERSVFALAMQVVAGLDYLMTEHRLVHGDVAARNILIGPDLSAKVSGLDVAFTGRRTNGSTRQRPVDVPLKWQAPERIMQRPAFDRSDVWSFGILLYELITLGSPPYPELEPVSVLPQLQQSYRMKKPEDCGESLYNLMTYCWMWSFKDRPTYSAIIKLLESSMYLAAAEALRSRELVDPAEYNKKAGVSP